MSFLLSLLAAKGLGALIGTIILLTRSVPGFAAPVLTPRNDTLYLQTVLTRGFNRELDQLLESGSLVAITYTLTLSGRDRTGATQVHVPAVIFHSAEYDPASGTHAVYRSEFAGSPDSIVESPDIAQTKALLARVDTAVLPLADATHTEYSCRIEAALNTVKLEALEDRELDLNVFWNYRYPRAATPWLKLPEP